MEHGNNSAIDEKVQEVELKLRLFGELLAEADEDERQDIFKKVIVDAAVELANENGDGSDDTIRKYFALLIERLQNGDDDASDSESDVEENMPPIFEAVKNNNLKGLRKIVKTESVGALETEFQALTPLMLAILEKRPKLASELVKLGANVNNTLDGQKSPLLLACTHQVLETVVLLIENGADVTFKGWSPFNVPGSGQIRIENVTPLFMASQVGNTEIARLLINRGADVNLMASHGFTPLMAALKHHQNDTAKFLIENGARIDDDPPEKLQVDSWACLNPLLACVTNDNVEMTNYLVNKGVRLDIVNERGATALKLAAMNGNFEIAKLLIDRGCDPNAADHDGWTALQNAAGLGHTEIVEILLAAGADPNRSTMNADPDEQGRTPLTDASYEGHEEIVALLLRNGADPNKITALRSTALREAVFADHFAVARMLIEAGADVNHICEQGQTPLSLACGQLLLAQAGDEDNVQEHIDLIKLLLDSGANPTICPEGYPGYYIVQATIPAVDDLAMYMVSKGALDGLANRDLLELLTSAASAANEEIFKTIYQKLSGKMDDADDFAGLIHALASSGRDAELEQLLGQDSTAICSCDAFVRAYEIAVKKGHRITGLLLLDKINASSPTIDQQDNDGYTAVMHAVVRGDIGALKKLLEEGANADRLDLFAETSLSFALEKHTRGHAAYAEIVDALIIHGAQVVESDPDSVESILSAASDGALGSIMVALRKFTKEDPNVSIEDLLNCTDDQENTPLILAARNGHAGLVRVLPLLGSDVNARNEDYLSAYEIAQASGFHGICESLAEYDAEDAVNQSGVIEWRLIPASESRRSGPGKDSDE